MAVVRTGIDVFHHRVGFLRIEIERTENGSPDVGNPVAALGLEHFRHGEAIGQNGRNILLLHRHEHFAVGGTAEHRGGRKVRTGIIVYEGRMAAVERNHVMRLFGRKVRHLSAGQVYFDDMLIIGVFTLFGAQSVGIGQHKAAFLVHKMDFPHVPLPFGELRNGSVPGVYAVKVAPVVPLRNPEHALAVLEQVAPEVVIIDEGIGLLAGQRTHGTGSGIHGAQLIQLMTALIIFIGKETRILRPLAQFQEVLVHGNGAVQGDLPKGRYVKQGRLALREAVSGLGVIQPAVFGLHLRGRTRFPQQDLALPEHILAQGGQLGSVGSPAKFHIGEGIRAVKAQLHGVGPVGIAHPHVVVPHKSHPGAVRRKTFHLAVHRKLAFVGRVVVPSSEGSHGFLEFFFGNFALLRPCDAIPGIPGGRLCGVHKAVIGSPARLDGSIIELLAVTDGFHGPGVIGIKVLCKGRCCQQAG